MLKHKFDMTLKKYGHTVYFVHFNRKIRCHCYREKEKEGSPDCYNCFGTGYPATIKRYLARRSILSGGILTDATRNEPPGQSNQSAYKYYFQSFVNPKSGDLILEPVKNNKGNTIGLSSVFLVSHSASQTMDDYKIIYHIVSARDQPSSIAHSWKSLIWHSTNKLVNPNE